MGLLCCMLIAAILPKDNDEADLKTNESWKIIFGLPIIPYAIMIIAFIYFIP